MAAFGEWGEPRWPPTTWVEFARQFVSEPLSKARIVGSNYSGRIERPGILRKALFRVSTRQCPSDMGVNV